MAQTARSRHASAPPMATLVEAPAHRCQATVLSVFNPLCPNLNLAVS